MSVDDFLSNCGSALLKNLQKYEEEEIIGV